MKRIIVKYHWRMLNLLFCFAFLWQLSGILDEWVNPSQETIRVSEKKLKRKFPLIIEICPDPGFNLTAIREEGYRDIEQYFQGQNMFEDSLIGWAGHSNTSRKNRTVEQVYRKVLNFPTPETFIIG